MRLQLVGAALLVLVARPGTAQQTPPDHQGQPSAPEPTVVPEPPSVPEPTVVPEPPPMREPPSVRKAAVVPEPPSVPEPPPMREPPAVSESPALREFPPIAPSTRRVSGRFHSEVAAYSDSSHVDVLTPSISGEVRDDTAGWSARGQYLLDAVSAASVDIVSTASPHWTEARHAGSVEGGGNRQDLGVTATGSFSSEPDYAAWAAGGSASLDLDQKNFVLMAGYGYGQDTIGRSGTPFSVFSRSLTRNALNAGLTIVVNPSTLVVVGGDLVFERGDQSKPYRYVPLFAADVAPGVPQAASIGLVNTLRLPERPLEQLPLARDRYAIWGRYLYRFSTSTLRLEERLYTDSWSLHASTTDVRFLVDRGNRWNWRSHVRFHAQSPVSFWKRAYTLTDAGVPALRTGDRELGPLWNATGGGGLRWRGGKPRPAGWTIGADLDLTWTSFLDDLYVGSRLAGIFTLSWEVEL